MSRIDQIFFWLCIVSMTYMAASSVAVFLLRRRRNTQPLPEKAPGVTIMKPIKGVDDDLVGNLRSFCVQDYPRYELVFAAQDPEDPARQLIEQLQLEFPDLPLRFFVQEPTPSLNPKVANLETIARYARYDLVLISDSNIRVPPDYLSDLVRTYEQPGIGMVTNMVCGEGEETPAAAFENMFLNGIILGGYAVSAAFAGHTFVLGKAMFFSLKQFHKLGGFTPLHKIIVEDEVSSGWFRKAGLGIRYGTRPIATYNRRWTFQQFLERHIRWARVRLRTATAAYFIEPLAAPLGPALLWVVCSGASRLSLMGCALAWLAVWMRDQLHARLMERPFFRWSVFFLLPAFAVFHFFLIVLAPWSNRISWRGQTYKIGRHTEILDD
ncbi:MAG: glycosyltransferase [Myxococcales bacterium]|nr:glycosyltransferase [Myxococcales bacterium]